jgi:hypothetical protein
MVRFACSACKSVLTFNNTKKVTDGGLKHLAGLKELRSLGLNGTQVTDPGLKELAGLKQLISLELFNTKVTDKGKADLKKALPKLRIRE